MAWLDTDQIQNLQRLQQLRETADANTNIPGISQTLAAYHQNYPWMSPDAKWSLAAAGVDPQSDTAQTAAAAAAHLEVNQGLAFQQVGSPVTKPSGPVDVSSILSGLDQQKDQKYLPPPATDVLAAPVDSPLKQVAGDAWNSYTPEEQQALNQVQIVQADPSKELVKPGDLKVANWDQLDPNTKAKAGELIRNAIGATYEWGDHSGFFKSDAGYFDANTGLFADQNHKLGGTHYDVLAGLAPLLRPASILASAPLQELTGQVRNLYQAATMDATSGEKGPNYLESQSDLGAAISQAGPKFWEANSGSGIFVDPTSPVEMERQRRISERGTINGEGVTLGRIVASSLPDSVAGVHVFEPGSFAYHALSGVVDAAIAIKADPTAKLLKEAAAAHQASSLFTEPTSVGAAIRAFRTTGEVQPALRAFQDAGGLSSLTRGVVSKNAANAWLDSADQEDFVGRLAAQKDPYTIYKALGSKDPELAVRIADASTPAEVVDTLRDHLGTTIRTKPSLSDLSSPAERTTFGVASTDQTTFRAAPPSKLMSMMPDSEVASDSVHANTIALERAAPLLKMDDGTFRDLWSKMARAQTPSERMGVWEDTMDATEQQLVGKGIGAQRAKTLTRLFQDQQATDGTYAATAIADGQGSIDSALTLNGKLAVATENKPIVLAQTLGTTIPLPDWRALRTALAPEPVRAVLENPAIAGAEYILNKAQGTVWKALQISTVKTMIKVLGDEQFAMAGRGYDSLMNHPLSALGIILATPLSELPEDAGFLARLRHASASGVRWGVESGLGIDPKLLTTAKGLSFDDLAEIQRVASHGIDSTVDTAGVLHANDWRVLEYQPGVNDAEFAEAHARHLAQYAASEDARGFLNAGSLQQAKDWYWDGPGAEFRDQLARSGQGQPELLGRTGADAHVEKVLNQMQIVTGGNADLLAAIRSGKLADTSIWSTVRDGTPQVSKNFVSDLADYSDYFPRVTPQQKAIYSGSLARQQAADGFFSRGIHILLGTPSAVLSKSPLFRQAYWERIIDNAPFMTADAQNEVMRVAEQEANIGEGLMGELRKAVTTGNKNREAFSGTLTLDQADEIAKGHGLDMVQRTTHEFSQRSQAFDMLRLLTPFGEVWRKTIQRWANIVAENPQVARRVQQGIEEAQAPGIGKMLGQPAGQGFFHTDSNGNEVFTVPGSEWATNALSGVPVPLVGDVKGLSLGTEFFPALGPVASIPVAWTLNKLNAPRDVTETLFPYGPPRNVSDLYNYTPSWFQKAVGHDRPTNPDSVRTFNNTVIDYVRYGVTNGDYDTSTPQGIQQAVEDATSKAHTLYMIRGAAQFFVPGAPSPELLVKDKTGRMVDAAALIQEYHDLSNKDPNTAGQIFLDKYGPDIFKATTAKSFEYTFGIPTSRDAADWVDTHADVKRDLPHIFGYFAPPSDPNNFDYEVYRQQLEPGQGRAALSPDQWARLANSRLAALQYGKLRDKVIAQNGGKEPDAGQRAWLAQHKQALIDQYPGYSDALYGGSGLPSRPDPKLLVLEAQKAVSNPTVLATDAGQGLKAYLAKRAQVDAQWVAAGHASGSWAQANGADGIAMRDWLRTQGAKITAAHAQFGPLMDSVFEREMRDDTNPNGGG